MDVLAGCIRMLILIPLGNISYADIFYFSDISIHIIKCRYFTDMQINVAHPISNKLPATG